MSTYEHWDELHSNVDTWTSSWIYALMSSCLWKYKDVWCQLEHVRMWYGDMWNVRCRHVRMRKHALRDVDFTRFWERALMSTLRTRVAYDRMLGMHELENARAARRLWPDVRYSTVRYCTVQYSTVPVLYGIHELRTHTRCVPVKNCFDPQVINMVRLDPRDSLI